MKWMVVIWIGNEFKLDLFIFFELVRFIIRSLFFLIFGMFLFFKDLGFGDLVFVLVFLFIVCLM